MYICIDIIIKMTTFISKKPKIVHTRSVYIERIKPFIGKTLIKALTGQRRVGKSYLLFQIIEEIQRENPAAPIIYINKEDLVFREIQHYTDLHDYIVQHQSKTEKTYVFIDEIQDITEFEKALRSLVLDENLDIYCTGSNANLLSGELASLLSGRFIEITVYSLSYTEFLEFHKLEPRKDSLEKYMKYGGLPYLIHLPQQEAVIFEYLKNIYTTILYRDIVQRHGIRNVNFLEQLVLFLADNTGSLFSAKKISDFLKSQRVQIAPNQVQTYLEYLCESFIISRVKRFDIKGKQLFETGEKYYFENLGVRHGIWGYRSNDEAKVLENIVYNHLLFKGYKVNVGVLHPFEIDFVAEKDGEKLYVQAALSLHEEKTMEREFGNLQKIKDNYPKMVVTMDEFNGNSIEGIKQLSLMQFLLQ